MRRGPARRRSPPASAARSSCCGERAILLVDLDRREQRLEQPLAIACARISSGVGGSIHSRLDPRAAQHRSRPAAAADRGRSARRCPSCRRGRCGRSGAAASRRRAAARRGSTSETSADRCRARRRRSRRSTRARPSRSACSAWLRSFWLCSPDSATAWKPRSTRLAWSRRTLSRVAQNSIAVSASWRRSRLTTACSISAGATAIAW